MVSFAKGLVHCIAVPVLGRFPFGLFFPPKLFVKDDTRATLPEPFQGGLVCYDVVTRIRYPNDHPGFGVAVF
jgi:hypothetical protein